MKRLIAPMLFALGANAIADIHYNVKVSNATKNFFVEMKVPAGSATEVVRIPRWSPGFYFINDYPNRMFVIEAEGTGGKKLRIQKPGDGKFVVENPEKSAFTLRYTVRGDDPGMGFFRAHIRQNMAFINGPAVFMYAENHMLEKHTANFSVPSGWDIATAMDKDAEGTFFAGGYDELIDHPLQLGSFVKKTFTVDKIPFEVIWCAEPSARANLDAETERLRLGSIPALKMMGGAPFKRYVIIIHLEVGDFAGGLEHRASNVMAVSNAETLHLDDLATHEFFHAWNIKQIRPKILGPFDYTSPQRTGNLWFSEGVTDYYAKIHAYQAGLTSRSQFLKALEGDIYELQNSSNRLKMTVEHVSNNAWENGGFGVGDLSYYTKGCVIGLLLDAKIRSITEGKSSLDDLMRTLFKKHQLPLPGFAEDDLRKELIALAGAPMGPFYDDCVRSSKELDYSVLSGIGLRLTIPGQKVVRAPMAMDDAGKVTAVPQALAAVGLRVGDIFAGSKQTADKVSMIFKRGDKLTSYTMTLRTYTVVDYRLEPNPLATTTERQRYLEFVTVP